MTSVQFASVEEQYRKFAGQLVPSAVRELGEWARSQPHLPAIGEPELMLFLHTNYYDAEAARRTIESYYTFRTSCKNLFGSRTFTRPDVQTAMSVVDLARLPELTPDGYRVLLAKVVDSDTSKFSFSSILVLATMCIDVSIWEEGCHTGSVVIIDMDGLHLGHLAKLGLFTLKDLLYYIQEGLPIRLKGLHLTNVVPFIDRILAMIRPFMKKELLEIIHLHHGMDTLYEHVPQRILPSEYGGTARSRKVLRDEMYRHTMECGDFLTKYDLLTRVDESKRIAKPRSMSNLFGLL